VSISPISNKVTDNGLYQSMAHPPHDNHDKEKMPPPNSHSRLVTQETPASKESLRGPADQSTPFDSCSLIKHLTTPSTAATALDCSVEHGESFWSEVDQMSPFASPLDDTTKRSATRSSKTGMSPMQKKRREEEANIEQ
jgi:hypothetical protein